MLKGKLQNPGEQIFGAWKGSNNLNAHDTLLGKCQGHQYWFKTRVVARLFCKIFSFLTGFMLIWLDKLNYMSLIVQVTKLSCFHQLIISNWNKVLGEENNTLTIIIVSLKEKGRSNLAHEESIHKQQVRHSKSTCFSKYRTWEFQASENLLLS